MARSEKPWYYSSIISFISDDVPQLTGLPRQLFARDVHTLERRLTCEGESFLTKTLPTLGKVIDRALQGDVPLGTTAFKKVRGTALPCFLSGLLGRVFNASGWVVDSPCTLSIRLLRQVCFWCKKIEKGYSDESLQRALAEFIEVDKSLPDPDHCFGEGVLGVAQQLVERLFPQGSVSMADLLPRHGPGAVESGDGPGWKRVFRVSYEALERVFRPIPWFFSLRDAAESPQRVYEREKKPFGLSRTEFVEKDSSGPRTIGLEPAEYMWVQQAIKGWMYNHIEKRSYAKGQINFSNQLINRELALDWQNWETLDMSKASDRNSYALVRQLFSRTSIWRYLQASRTPGTRLPNGDILWYRKFAPMGSAVCFPVEAVVFYCLAVATLHLSGYPLKVACRSVFVYGDDLIVPRGLYNRLSEVFEKVGLKFNADKCCIHGRFRESCGMDAFAGVDVTPARMKKVYPKSGQSVLLSLVKHANRLMSAGYRSASIAFREAALESFPDLKRLGLPRTPRGDLPILAWFDDLQSDEVRYLSNPKGYDGLTYVKGWVWDPIRILCPLAGEAFYLRESLSRGGPVGKLERKASPSTGWRYMDARYSGRLRKRRLVIVRE